MHERPEVIARDSTPRGDVVLRRRTPGTSSRDGSAAPVIELIVNGAFVMDTVDTSTERLLATVALERVPEPTTVIVGGLGLGFTVQALLGDARVRRIDVIELEPALVQWVGEGLVPETAGVLADSRVRPHVADVKDWLPGRPDAEADAILLDVDNGPGFLVHQANALIYERPFLAELARVLRPGGAVVVWSSARARTLHRLLERQFGACAEIHRVVHREGRSLDYYLYAAGHEPSVNLATASHPRSENLDTARHAPRATVDASGRPLGDARSHA